MMPWKKYDVPMRTWLRWNEGSIILFCFAVVMAICVFIVNARAGSPRFWGDYSPEVHQWFPTVMQPGYEDMHDAGHSCCGSADAFEVRVTGEDEITGDIIVTIDDGKTIVLDGTVIHVPKSKLQTHYGNPFPDKLILFMSTGFVVYCLVPNSGT